jgi:hypothetical protein
MTTSEWTQRSVGRTTADGKADLVKLDIGGVPRDAEEVKSDGYLIDGPRLV